MTREDIEKAAVEFANDKCQKRGCSKTYRLHFDFDRYDIERSFEAGADWRINSVWHDMSKEIPKEGKQCLIETTYKNGYIPHYRLTQWYEVNEFINQDDAKVRWAYIEDLLSKTEE